MKIGIGTCLRTLLVKAVPICPRVVFLLNYKLVGDDLVCHSFNGAEAHRHTLRYFYGVAVRCRDFFAFTCRTLSFTVLDFFFVLLGFGETRAICFLADVEILRLHSFDCSDEF